MDDLKLPRGQLLSALGAIGDALQKARRQFKDIKIGDRNWPIAVAMLPKPLDGNRTIDAKSFGSEFEAEARKLNRHLSTMASSHGPSNGEKMIAAIDEGLKFVEALEMRL